MKLSQLKVNPKNPRFIKDFRYEKLKKSIEEFPKMMELRPIIVDDDNMILGGNMRFRALTDLGFKDVPDTYIKKASELTEEEKQRFIIEDNVAFGEWDFDILANEWNSDDLMDWGVDIPFGTESNQSIEGQENTNAVGLDYIVWDNKRIAITEEESEQFTGLLNQYVDEFTLPIGFLNWIINQCKK
jgi:hypothetical protein